jgi:hypothetical protein
MGLGLLRKRVLSALTRPTKKAPLNANVHAELAAAFRDEIMLMSQLLGRDFSHWLEPKRKAAASADLQGVAPQ